MKVLITGGCGFLGSNIAAKFLELDNEVLILDNLSRDGSQKNLYWLKKTFNSKNLHFYNVDVSNKKDIDEIFQQNPSIDYVCHLAGQVAMTKSINNPLLDFNTNVIGTINVLEAVRNFCPTSFIAYSSTNKVYGDLDYLTRLENKTRYYFKEFVNGLDETLSLDFSTPYGCSKGAADQYIRDYARVFGLQTTVFRHSSIYGGRQFSTFDQGWVGWFCKQAIMQKNAAENYIDLEPFTISGTGKQVRDLLHAEDLVDLYQKAFENKDVIKGQIFNIGGGINNALSLLELFEILENILEIKALKYTHLDRRKSDQDFFVADIGKIKNLISWYPKINKEEGIKKMVEWTVELNKL